MKHDGEKREKLESLLAEGNRWATAAPLLVLSVAKRSFTRNGKPNRHYVHDNGSAMENMFLQAAAMGLQGHGMAGFDVEKACVAYAIGDDFEPLTMMAFGEHDSNVQDPALKDRDAKPRIRKSQEEFTFHGYWKES
jgi:nitroreductase